MRDRAAAVLDEVAQRKAMAPKTSRSHLLEPVLQGIKDQTARCIKDLHLRKPAKVEQAAQEAPATQGGPQAPSESSASGL